MRSEHSGSEKTSLVPLPPTCRTAGEGRGSNREALPAAPASRFSPGPLRAAAFAAAFLATTSVAAGTTGFLETSSSASANAAVASDSAGSLELALHEWVWVSGSNAPYPAGVYGSEGVPAPGNVPGGRESSVSWRDASGNLWLFGGRGKATSSTGLLSDLWKWDGTNWTWMNGPNTVDELGVYGAKGVAAAGNVPGARYRSVSWRDASGNLWLFGGSGFAASGSGYLNDLWKWDGTNWTWVSGSNATSQAGVYGSKGVPASGNVPGARQYAVSWTDASGNLWLFGGYGHAASGVGSLNDLWKWDGTNWTWVSGSNTTSQSGVYGVMGVPAAANRPGGREGSVSWRDASGNLWLFGGQGRAASGSGYLNDLWKWDGTDWTWMSGSNSVDQPGVYGVKGVPAAANRPGGRGHSVSWTDASGSFWFFGGYLSGPYGSEILNDLWKWDGTNWTWVNGSDAPYQTGVYGTRGVPAAENVPGARYRPVSWTDGSGSLWLFGGDGMDSAGAWGLLGDLWAFGMPACAVPSASITGPSLVCASSPGNVASVPDAGPMASYAWEITNGVITAGGTTREVTFTAGASGTVGLSVTVTPADVCTPSQASLNIPVQALCLDPIPAPIVVGGTNVFTGSGFTAGSVIKLFVSTASGPLDTNTSGWAPTSWTSNALTWDIPPTVSQGQGFATVQVVNTDQGYISSNLEDQLLVGDAADGLPTIQTINGVALSAPDPSIPGAHVETVLAAGSTVTITGTGFAGPLVNLYTATGNIGPLTPLPGGTATSFQVVIPSDAPAGPGTFQVVNSGAGWTVSNAVDAVLRAQVTVTSASVTGTTVTVTGDGFCALTVINLFNVQGGNVVNLGGLTGGGAAVIPLTVPDAQHFTFELPVGAQAGPAYVQALNPPFTPYTSSGTDPGGAFDIP